MSETQLVPVPPPTDINHGVSPAQVASMKALLGVPDIAHGEPSHIVQARLETRDVGPFKMRGLNVWVGLWGNFLAWLKSERPWLYNVIGTAGTLDVRYVHGTTIPSNHAWGTATDIKIGGELTQQGSSTMLKGYEDLYEAWKAFTAADRTFMPFWGVGYPRRDPMHYDAPIEMLLAWKREGKL